ncbi:OprO/OprP family phosphate-selective porin [Halorhodospira neutriphila]|uniref:Phosphate-selective porin O and P n=1 Tax=Halorhodospira neutriphila TaxID=168379 RepID=A0ABS1E6C0_9GAMM|nr:porin [Halorhodospira neutriphila]MBK1727281.1 hypothetical protein [Halorhodospira neutriphila]
MTGHFRLAAPALLVAAGGLTAPQAGAQTQSDVYDYIDNRLTNLESKLEGVEGGQEPWSSYVSEFGGRIMYDQTFAIDSDDSLKDGLGVDDLEEGAELRRARFFAEGAVAPWLAYKLQIDFGDGDVSTKDAYIKAHGLGGLPSVKVGHFKEPISLEEQTSSKYISLMSRTMLTDGVISQGRNHGLMLTDHYGDDQVNVALGVFDTGQNGKSAITGRITAPVVYSNGGRQVVHLGASLSQRNVDTFELGLEPEVHKTDDFVATRDVSDSETGVEILVDDTQVSGVELGAVLGPAHFQSEYGQLSLSTADGTDPSVDTYYVQGGFFLTGESRPYDKADGGFGRVKPNRPFTGANSGSGAWELVARYSVLDAEEMAGVSAIDGDGNSTSVAAAGVAETNVTTFGLNWYPVAHAKWMLNYVNADQDALGSASYVATRFQVDF